VLNFRLVYDRETGKPKGFGFAEYPDEDSAATAVRHLNDHEVQGRKLRVDFSSDSGNTGDDDHAKDKDGGRSGGQNGHRHTGSTTQAGSAKSEALPPLPPGKDLPPGVTATDAISRTLNTLPPSQLLDILTQMKTLATNDPARATQLLTEAPQLSYAIFQALLLLGLVSPEAISSVIETGGGPAATPAPVPPPAAFAYPGVGAVNTPPVNAAGGYAPPPPVPAAPTAAPAPAANPLAALTAPAGGAEALDPAALMQAVMDLPQAMIDQLPEGEKQQILALRASYAGQGR
jgi:cleavage stimulation factor subunit 2